MPVLMDRLRSELDEKKRVASTTLRQYMAAAQRENRQMTEAERSEVETLLTAAKSVQTRLDALRSDVDLTAQIDAITGGDTPAIGPTGRRIDRRSLGQQFASSETFRWLQATKNTRTGVWQSPVSELSDPYDFHATTLSEDPASGGGLVVPDTRVGILPLPTRPPVVRDLIAPGRTTSNLVQFMEEKTFTNAAAAVAEAAAKPESTLVFEAATSPVQKLAHWIPATNEILDDVAQMASYIDSRLRIGLQLTEDDELLNGTGIAPHLLGFLQLPNLAAAVARGADTNADCVAKQIAAIATAVNLMPTGIVMHPSNFLSIQLAKNANGDYTSGEGPLAPLPRRVLWGLPCALTTAIALGSALVGSFATAAQIFDKTGIRVDVSNSHSDFFVKNLVAVRAEERLALAVYRQEAFGLCTGLS